MCSDYLRGRRESIGCYAKKRRLASPRSDPVRSDLAGPYGGEGVLQIMGLEHGGGICSAGIKRENYSKMGRNEGAEKENGGGRAERVWGLFTDYARYDKWRGLASRRV